MAGDGEGGAKLISTRYWTSMCCLLALHRHTWLYISLFSFYLDLCQWNCWCRSLWTQAKGSDLRREIGFGSHHCCWTWPIPRSCLPLIAPFHLLPALPCLSSQITWVGGLDQHHYHTQNFRPAPGQYLSAPGNTQLSTLLEALLQLW